MRTPMLACASLLALSACSATTPTAPVSASAVSTTLDSIRLFCAVKDSTVALATVSGSTLAPVIAKGASSAYVQAACALAGGIAVVPPAKPGDAPVVMIPAVSIPLRQ